MAPIKFTQDHPAFQRVAQRIQQHIEDTRDKTIALAVEILAAQPLLAIGKPKHEAIAEIAYQIEFKRMKKLARQNGLAGKYVAH